MQHGRQAQLIDVLKLDLDRPRAQVELIGDCDQMRERRSFQRYRMPAPQRRQIYAVAMEARDHREASQTAFSRFRLQDHRHAPASGEIQKFEHVLSCMCLVCGCANYPTALVITISPAPSLAQRGRAEEGARFVLAFRAVARPAASLSLPRF